MRVLITGATGLIGQEIVRLCHEKGIEVNYLTTRISKIQQTENYKGFHWDPKTQEIDISCFNDVDVIIHLAGATVTKRWTKTYKKEILSSRIEPTKLLIHTLKSIPHNIKQVVSASAIGIYPDSLVNYYDQSYDAYSDAFLGRVVQAWEQAIDGFSELNITVSKIRIGLVLSNRGGALQEMVKPIKIGLGAAFGSGKQWQSWIHIQDLANMFLYVAEKRIHHVFNGVAPNPVSNNELIKTIGKVLNKPVFLPNIPRFFMKLVLGEMHTILFDSQRVSSKKIENKGFYFRFHHLRPALADLLKD